MGHIDHVKDRPNFTNLRHLETQLINGAKKIEYRNFKKKEYAQILQEDMTNMMFGEVYSTSFQAVGDDASTIVSITEGLKSYAEKQSTTENNVNTLCEQMAFLTHQINAQQHQLQALMAPQPTPTPP